MKFAIRIRETLSLKTATQLTGTLVKLALAVTFMALVASSAPAAVFHVTNNNDSGPGSLRQAILDSNAGSGPNTIFFSIGSGGAQTITLQSALPFVTTPVTIDATSQPGYPGTPIIEINGNGVAVTGLYIPGGNTTITGLVITRFIGSGIVLLTKGKNTIINNYIGVSASGTIDRGNGNAGISIESGSSQNVIGGSTAGTRNVISGNEGNGIQILSGDGNQILGNYIGTNAAGTAAIGNGSTGIRVTTSANLIGSPIGTGRNVISGNGFAGISVDGAAATGNSILANNVGVDVTGLVKLSNGTGIELAGTGNVVGGLLPGSRNVISGNVGTGLAMGGDANKVLANYIGVAANGTGKLGNATGMSVFGLNHVIGGAGVGNVISGNDNEGIYGHDLAGITITGNLIGTDATGSAALGNGSNGLRLFNLTGSTIGGSSLAESNVICANGLGGISLEGDNSIGNAIKGNYVGLDKTGAKRMGNGFGIAISGGSNNVIGGSGSSDRNLVVANTGNGIGVVNATDTTVQGNLISGNGYGLFLQKTRTTKIQGNLIGTNLGGAAADGNTGFGIYMVDVTGTTIGGPSQIEGNVVSANASGGISINGAGSNGNAILGNYVGTDKTGTIKMGNGSGIEIRDGSNNVIGGSGPADGNVVCANTYGGILISGTGSTGNKILGNYVGTDKTGTSRMGNAFGIGVSDGSNNFIGGSGSGDRNVIIANTDNGIGVLGATDTTIQGNLISGNGYGVYLSSAVATQIQGNLIGTTASGTAADGNTGFGMYLFDSRNTTIGGTTAAARNVISGNGRSLAIAGKASTGNLVQGNFIGLDITGSVRIANHGSGVELGGVNNTIGGTVPGAGNVISGNDNDGVGMFGTEIDNNKIQGNIIGLNAAGTAAIGNGGGIRIIDAANTLIGGPVAGARNIISGNSRGITVEGLAAATVQGNYIGTDISGTAALGNDQEGILISSANNIVGGTSTGARNLISGNGTGITIEGTSTGNLVQGNYIGTKVNGTDFLPNVLIGIRINTSFGNTIGGTTPGAGNTVAGNNYAGVVIDAGTGNAILGNSIFGNARLGIELSGQDAIGLNENDPGDPDSGANWKQNYPLLTSVIASGGNTSIQGKLNSNPNKQFRIEFFSNTSCDDTGFGEGQTFIGSASVTTDASGDAVINASLPLMPTGQFITATATSPDNDTSEFSPCALVGGANPGALQFESSFYLAEEFLGIATITVTRTNGMAGAVSVNYATSDGSAISPDDYTPTSGTLNFADGEVIKTFTVPIVYDSLFNEGQEGVNLTLSNPTGGATLGSQSTSSLLINNNTPAYPGSSFSDASVVEGDNGTTNAVFTITLSPHTDVVTVGYATVDGLATAPADYESTSGQLIFNPGENSKTVSVPVKGDTVKEGNEMFFLNLQLQSEGYTLKSQGEGMIIDDDGSLSFQFSQPSYSVNESGGSATVTVNRTGDIIKAVTVDYTTVDDTATASSDYGATSGTLSFASGETSKTFTVNINDDAQSEGDEKVTLKLSNATAGAALGSPSTAVLTIVDNDAPPAVLPALSITDVSLAEGNNGTTQFSFTVSLSAAGGQPVSVAYATADNSAVAGSDYQGASGQLNFAPNEVSKTISVMVDGDTQIEPAEKFFVNLSNPTNATIFKSQGTGTIENDDAGQQGALAFSTTAYSVNENGGTAAIKVSRVGGSDGAISVEYATVLGGSAASGSDYAVTSGTLSWTDGDTKDKTFTVSITDDSTNEANETINLVLSNPIGGAVLGSPASAVLTIIEDDPAPAVSIDDVSLTEGNSGTTNFTFNVSLSAASGQPVSVNYNTADTTAQVGSDYQAANGVLTFKPGETSKQITVPVNGDTQVEPDETFAVNLSSVANATIAKSAGAATIVNDDGNSTASTIEFSQSSYSVPEELSAMTVTVTRTGDSSGAAAVDYTTVDGSATQKADFEYGAGTLTFAAGETSKTVTILLNEDILVEGNETFSITLSNPAGAVLGAQSSTTATIVDDLAESMLSPVDEAQSFVYTHYHDFLNREPDPAGLAFWTSQITACGADAKCIDAARVNVSASFFLSIEFQETAYLLYLMQKESYSTMPQYASFMRDLQEVSRGVIVNAPGWQQKLADNQQQFADKWVNRAEFKVAYDALSNDAYVNALYKNAGIVAPQTEKDNLVAALNSASMNRSAVLLEVAGDATFRQQEQNAAFVLMEYFGYLRRDPNASPDSDLSGYNFWLNKLNQFGGNYVDSEMIKAFITSFEYRQRFGN